MRFLLVLMMISFSAGAINIPDSTLEKIKNVIADQQYVINELKEEIRHKNDTIDDLRLKCTF